MGYRYQSSRSATRPNNFRRGQNRRPANRNNRRTGQYIDPSRFIKEATAITEVPYVPLHTFEDFPLTNVLKRNVANKNYVTPSPIQDQAIPLALSGKDVIGIASTGTGKTAAFALPMLQKLLTNDKSKALIIAPTRELAEQIEGEFIELAKGTNLYGVLLIGGASMGFQLRALQRNPRIIIGTPGRIKDHIKRGSLKLAAIDMLALDEVDRMLDMGFVNDVREILGSVSENRQSLFFSATMDTRIRTLIDEFMKSPVTVSLKPSSASSSVHQDVIYYSQSSDKIDKLHDLLIHQDTKKVIIFNETKHGVERLYKELSERGFSAASIHGNKNQSQRQRALKSFKQSQISVLVATDVAARGIDVNDITHVINYTVPNTYDDYIHRIGRAGRAGNIGHALTFIEKREVVGKSGL